MNKFILTLTTLALTLSACGAPATPTLVPPTQPASTNTPLPLATPSPVGTPTPVSTFPPLYSEMSNPALAPVDIRVHVKNDAVTGIFYLKDVPAELTFDREDGVVTGGMEYMWKICIDTDNDKNTGASLGWLAGADYCLWAAHFKESDTPKAMSMEQGLQVSISELDGESEKKISDGTIEVDVEGNTIKLSGIIPGITSSSQLYYEIYDGYSGTDISSPLFDRIFIEQ